MEQFNDNEKRMLRLCAEAGLEISPDELQAARTNLDISSDETFIKIGKSFSIDAHKTGFEKAWKKWVK